MKKTRQAVYQHLFDYGAEFPVRVDWTRGRFSSSYPLSRHRELEFHYIKRGRGAYFIQGENYPFEKNSFLVIRGNEIHNFIARPDSYVEKAVLMFSSSVLKNIPERRSVLPLSFRHLRLSEEEGTQVEMILNAIGREAVGREEHYRRVIRADLVKLLLLLKRFAGRDQPPALENPLVKEALDYIEANFTGEITVPLLSGRLARSASHFAHLFKKFTGLGVKQYVIQRRIIEAKLLLEKYPEIKITSLHRRVGFGDFSVFNRNFKHVTGLTPAAYRRISYRISNNCY